MSDRCEASQFQTAGLEMSEEQGLLLRLPPSSSFLLLPQNLRLRKTQGSETDVDVATLNHCCFS